MRPFCAPFLSCTKRNTGNFAQIWRAIWCANLRNASLPNAPFSGFLSQKQCFWKVLFLSRQKRKGFDKNGGRHSRKDTICQKCRFDNPDYPQFKISKLKACIPGALSQLTGLTNLELQSNLITGSIPSAMSTLTILWTLSLRVNELRGPIPEMMISP